MDILTLKRQRTEAGDRETGTEVYKDTGTQVYRYTGDIAFNVLK
jgi:hypothetical protein